MAKNYEYIEVNITDLLLDDENPRFASSILVQDNTAKVSQTAIINHLLKYADIIKIANRINEVQELHGAELITCYKRDNKYIVLEGNRRTCACKLLLDRSLIPDNYKSKFPILKDETKDNIEKVLVIVYPNREAVQAFLSDRHINGVKKWAVLEKNNYYMNLFNTYGDFNEVKKYTSDTIGTIRKSIKKYQFFMDVFHVLKSRYNKIEIENLDYLPMVDRFMDLLVGKDSEVGLDLSFDKATQKYSCEIEKQHKYNDILMLVGEAFLLRKEKKYCKDGEISKIISTEIYGFSNQKELILKDQRIPGLITLITDFKGLNAPSNDLNAVDSEEPQGDVSNNGDAPTGKNDGANNGNNSNDEKDTGEEKEKYIPSIKFKPKKTKREYLCFTADEAKSLKISGDSDFEVKIRSLLYDLSTLSVYEHPYACAFLYRSLLEVTTRLVYYRHASSISNPYNEKDLVTNMNFLNNNFIFVKKIGKDIPKLKEAIKSNHIIQILNLYIHYSNPVDEQILLSSWNTMKFYIHACLEK